MLTNAIEIAARVHEGQQDKAGDPYIFHSMRVMLNLKGETEQICGILHDVIENSEWTLNDLSNEGFSDKVIEVLDCVTIREGEEYHDYIDRVLANPAACRVKLEDLRDNIEMTDKLADSDEKEEKLQKYQNAQRRIKGVLSE